MNNTLRLPLLALFISQSAFAARYALHNDNIAITFDKTNSAMVMQDTRSGQQLAPQQLFLLTLPDETQLKTTDFTIKDVQQRDNSVVIHYVHADFTVTVTLYLQKGKYVSIDYTFSARNKTRQVAKITLFPTQKQAQAPWVAGSIASSPLVVGSFFILPNKPVVNTWAYEATTNLNVELKTPLVPGTPISYTAWFGTFADVSQLRRSVNQFINAVRPRPYKPYLHYNSWMDIGYFTPYTEQDVLRQMDEWDKAFITGRGVTLDAFLLDDGWDDRTGRWLFGPAFSQGFGKVKAKADSLHSSVGLWLSPWGGYNKPRDIRVSYAGQYGFETVDGKFALSGPRYFENFNQQILSLINNEHITSFKLDGMGNASTHLKGSPFASDFDASVALLKNMRQANPDLFINLTTGTSATPSWLFYADTIWRQGDDINLYGPGSPAQQWITYRDAETYRSVVRQGPLFPLNSLMYHGIVSAENAYYGLEKPQSNGDFADQVWSYFATGTQLQELYITPQLLNQQQWDTLAQAAKWARANAAVLFDTHWTGGDPTLLEVYGWASWSTHKGILGLRNPSDKPQRYWLDLTKAFEVPQGEVTRFRLNRIYGTNQSVPALYQQGVIITLQPLETLVLEAVPVT